MSEKTAYTPDRRASDVSEMRIRGLCRIVDGFLDNFGEDFEKNDTRVASFRNDNGDEVTFMNIQSPDESCETGYRIVTTLFMGTEKYPNDDIEHYVQKTFYVTPENGKPYYRQYWLEEDDQGELIFSPDEDLPPLESLNQNINSSFLSGGYSKSAKYYNDFLASFGSSCMYQDDLDFIYSLLLDDSFKAVAPRIYM